MDFTSALSNATTKRKIFLTYRGNKTLITISPNSLILDIKNSALKIFKLDNCEISYSQIDLNPHVNKLVKDYFRNRYTFTILIEDFVYHSLQEKRAKKYLNNRFSINYNVNYKLDNAKDNNERFGNFIVTGNDDVSNGRHKAAYESLSNGISKSSGKYDNDLYYNIKDDHNKTIHDENEDKLSKIIYKYTNSNNNNSNFVNAETIKTFNSNINSSEHTTTNIQQNSNIISNETNTQSTSNYNTYRDKILNSSSHISKILNLNKVSDSGNKCLVSNLNNKEAFKSFLNSNNVKALINKERKSKFILLPYYTCLLI